MPETLNDRVERNPLAAMVEAIIDTQVLQSGAEFVLGEGGDTVSVQFTWADIATAKAQAIVGDAAKYDHNRGLGPRIPDPEDETQEIQKPWDDLSNQEKLDMIFQAAQRLIVAQAKTVYVNEAQNSAKGTATEYVDEEYSLE